MSPETESTGTTRVRSLTRWGVPFHYAPSLAAALVGLLMLSAGGTVAVIGGWWLATALPIAIGGVLRGPWFAFGPLAVWVLWLIIVAVSSSSSGIAHTPTLVALGLSLLGGLATRVAQYAIFPATARDAWEPTVQRLAHLGDDDANGDREGHDDAAADSGSAPEDAKSSARADEEAGQMTLSIDALTPVGTAEVDALAAEQPDVPEAPKTEHRELPLGADPHELDEGGHVSEFTAITEADVLAAGAATAAPAAPAPKP